MNYNAFNEILVLFLRKELAYMEYTLKNIANCPIKSKTTVRVTSDFGKRRFYNKITKHYESGYHNGLDNTEYKNRICGFHSFPIIIAKLTYYYYIGIIKITNVS